MGKFPISLTILGMAFQIHSLQSMSQDELLRYVQEFIGKKLQVLLKKDVCVVGTLRVLDSISIHLTEVLIIKLDSRESRSEYWVFLDRIRELEDRS
jgi:small nuclear ribonucleoprotein (snRNP)-like protein